MATLEDLLQQSLGGIIEGGGLPTEEALYQRQAQAEREATFGRGLGISSVTRDALAKARMDAALAAQNAQLAALGQAAGITQANANRTQQESQFARSLSQQKRALGQQGDIANQQMLASGIGAGAGAALQLGGLVYAPEIQGGLRRAFGLPAVPGRGGVPGGGGVPAGAMPTAAESTIPSLDALATATIPDYSAAVTLPDLGTTADWSSAFSVPSFDAPSLDLSSLYDLTFPTAYDWGSYF